MNGFTTVAFDPFLPLWANVPGVSIIQFPWRLVGPASLALALLAGRALPLAAMTLRRMPRSSPGPACSSPPSPRCMSSR